MGQSIRVALLIHTPMKVEFDTKWLEAISDLDDPLRLALIDGIFAYLEGRDPLLCNEAFRIFCTLKPFIDEVVNKRIRIAERSRQNGMKGGRKKAEQPKEEPKETKGFEAYLLKPEYQGRCDNLLRLDEWKKKNTPYIYKNIRPLTQKEFECLCKKYNSKQICDTLLQIENRKDLRRKYVDPYRTLLNWMKRSYENS